MKKQEDYSTAEKSYIYSKERLESRIGVARGGKGGTCPPFFRSGSAQLVFNVEGFRVFGGALRARYTFYPPISEMLATPLSRI